jgi:hypothetical protein
MANGTARGAGAQLLLPRERTAHPDPERLELRYEQFRAAS